MVRTACIDLPAFPLQLLLRRQPDWQRHPVAVVDSDRPQGLVRWVNERARAQRILPGMHYAAALSLAGELRAAEVPAAEIERAVRALVLRLQRFTPGVEPAPGEPGVFWLDATGLERLHGSWSGWADLVRTDLERQGFRATAVVGFSRFGPYAVAKARQGTVVLEGPEAERRAARVVPLERLALEPAIRETLTRLGVLSVGELVDLPVEGIARRFGPEALRLHQAASGAIAVPLAPARPETPIWRRTNLDRPEADVPRLMAVFERMLGTLLDELWDRGQALVEIRFGFRFERTGDHIELIRPASATLDARQILELIRLRMEAIRKLPDGAVEVVLIGQGLPATGEQLRLFAGRSRRDPEAARRALARVRAELGDGAVVQARLREGHLPEARFTWVACAALPRAQPHGLGAGRLVRRIYARPIPLPSRPRQEPDGWMLRSLEQGPVVRSSGPYVVSGGWWSRAVHREYHFAETQKGELLWVYYDRVRRSWFLQGRVE